MLITEQVNLSVPITDKSHLLYKEIRLSKPRSFKSLFTRKIHNILKWTPVHCFCPLLFNADALLSTGK